MTVEQLKELLDLHDLWLYDNSQGKRLDLSYQNLKKSDFIKLLKKYNLSYANLRNTNLSGANLSSINLRGADLSYAKLHNVNLSYATLFEANLCCITLSKVNLNGADLRNANLSSADLRNANLYGADLSRADFYGACLTNANLFGVYLYDTNFYKANLNGAKNIPYIKLACPDTGSFIGWKKVQSYIIKLRIPSTAKRSSATTNKCRCSFAKVLAIQNIDGNKANVDKVINTNYTDCIYQIGEIVYPDSFDENRWNECSNGIHFFINRQDAVNY